MYCSSNQICPLGCSLLWPSPWRPGRWCPTWFLWGGIPGALFRPGMVGQMSGKVAQTLMVVMVIVTAYPGVSCSDCNFRLKNLFWPNGLTWGRHLHSLGLWVLTKQEGLLCRGWGSHRLFLYGLKQGGFPDVFFLQLYEGHKASLQVSDCATHCTRRSPWPFSTRLQGLSQCHILLFPYLLDVSVTPRLILWYEVLSPETAQARWGVPPAHFVILGCWHLKHAACLLPAPALGHHWAVLDQWNRAPATRLGSHLSQLGRLGPSLWDFPLGLVMLSTRF